MESLQGVSRSEGNVPRETEQVDIFENDPVRSMLTPVQNEISRRRNAPVTESIQQLPVERQRKSDENTQLLNDRHSIEKMRFSSEPEAAKFLLSVADPAKLRLKDGINMTKQPGIEDYDWNSIIDALPKGNMTVGVALEQVGATRKARQAIGSSSTLKEAAVKYAAMQNGATGDQVRELEGFVPESQKANLVLGLLNDPAAVEVIAASPELTRQANNEILQFPTKYPTAAVRILAEKISEARESGGYNRGVGRGILGIPSAKVSDEIVDKLVKSGDLPKQFADFYKKPDVRVAVNMNLKTPGFLENFGASLGETFLGTGKSVAEVTGIRSLYKSGDEKLFDELDKQYSNVVFKPKGLYHKIQMFGGEITGQVLPMALGGNLVKAAGITKSAAVANAISAGAQTFGNNVDRARAELPGEHWTKQLGLGLTYTGIEVALANVMNDTKLARSIVMSQSPAIRQVINKFTNKEITAAAAKGAIRNIYDRMVVFGKGFAKTPAEETVEESSTEALHIAANQAFGGEEVGFSESVQRVFEVGETTLLGSGLLGVGGGVANLKSSPSTGAMLLQMAEAPQKYRDIIDREGAIDPNYAIDLDQKRENLDFIVQAKAEAEKKGMSKDGQAKYVLAALNEKILNEQANDIVFKDARPHEEKIPVLKEIEQQMKESEAEKNTADEGTPAEIVKEFAENGLLNEIETNALMPGGVFDESKVPDYLKTIAQQQNGLGPDWKPLSGGAAQMGGVPSFIRNLANETFHDEIQKAWHEEIKAAGVDKLTEEIQKDVDGLAKDSGIVEVDQKEIIRQMQPFTDKMAEIEMQVENAGYKVDEDYDNQIIVTYKDGEIVEPEDVPKSIQSLIGQYEDAVRNLGEFDNRALNASLEDSRKRIRGEEVQAQIVPPKKIQIPEKAQGKLAAFKKKREQAAAPESQPSVEQKPPPKGTGVSEGGKSAGFTKVFRGMRSGVHEPGGYTAGKFVTTDKVNAERYDKNVQEFYIPDSLNVLDYNSTESDGLVREFLESLGEEMGGKRKGGEIDFDDKMSLFTGESEEVWVEFLQKKGYDATTITNRSIGRPSKEFHIFDPQKHILYESDLNSQQPTQPSVEQKPATGTNVSDVPATKPDKSVKRKIRDEKQRKQIDDAWDDFMKGGGLLTSGGLDPERIEKGTKLVGLYIKSGIYKFSDIVEDAYGKFGEKLRNFMSEIKAVYAAYYNSQATDEEAAQMDANVRGFNLDDVIKNLQDDRGATTTDEQQGVQKPSGLAQNNPPVDVPGDEQGGTGGLGDQEGGSGTSAEGRPDEEGDGGRPGTGDNARQSDVPLNGNDKLNEDLGGHSEEQPLSKPKDQEPVVSPLQHNGNFIIPPDFTHNRSFNVAQKLQDNIDALKVVMKLEEEGRNATYEEQQTLFKYVGWGGIKEIAFNPDSDNGWANSNKHLKSKIREALFLIAMVDPKNSESNISAVRSSILNAHYTAIPVIRGIWNILRKGGFKGGTVLEPSAGTGNFIGAMPIDLVEKSRIGAIELDPITSKILKGLYPNHIVKNAGYQDVAAKNIDLIISNIPFGNYAVFDKNFQKSKDPVLKKAQKKIHSYFFARAIDDTSPDGLIAFVTSTGIMDSKDNRDLRQMMAERTEFLGAIRLPNDTFQGNANTAVTTDIIFLRKLGDAEAAVQKHNFLDAKSVSVKHKDRDENFKVPYNEYFHDNPEMMLGEVRAGSMYGASKDGITDAMTLIPKEGTNIEEAITALAGKIFNKDAVVRNQNRDTTAKERATASMVKGNERPGNMVKISEGVYGIMSEQENEDGTNVVHPIRIAKKYQKAAEDLIVLRASLNNLYAAEFGDMGADFIESKRHDLNEAYKTFVKNNGTLIENKPLVDQDIDGYNMLALEKTEGKKVVGLADIFSKRVFSPRQRAEKADNVSDAIIINLNETGDVDINRVAELLKITPEEAIKKSKGILFKNPQGGFETKDRYLSGNVRKKLEDARIAAAEDSFYEDNVKALEAVQPADLNAAQIYAPISASWINPKYINQFASELFKQNVHISRLSTGRVNVDGSSGTNVQVGEEYGTSRMNGFQLLEEALQNRLPIVKDTFKDGDRTVTVVNETETQKAIEKVEKIKNAFDNWIWQDDARRSDLVDYYNKNFNNTVIRNYDGSHLTFDGYTGELTPRKHQLDGAWMIMQQMGGILDHIVGSGKTLLMVLTAQKMKEMGLIKKPIIIGLKANTADVAERYRKSFPLAKILSPTEKDFSPDKRRTFFAKMANNDWDAIIMTHDQFGMIPQSVEMQKELIEDEMAALESDIRSAKDNNLSKTDIKNLEIRLQNLKAKLLSLTAMAKDESLKDFEAMAIDFMFVDESQQFKNLSYTTIQRGVAGLGDPLGSNKAFNMLVAVRTLQKMYGGDKGTVFASGTPISNTMVEMYLLFKYLRPNKMAELGIHSFDQWANTFARVGSEIEFGVTNSLKPKVRMRDFMNVPEMSAMYREIADVRNDSNLELEKPKFKKTARVKTNKNLPAFSIVDIGGSKFKVIGRIKGIEKDEYWVSLKSVGKDAKLPASGTIKYEGEEVGFSDVEYSDGLLINVPPTIEQRKFAKKIQKFAETKDGKWIGRNLTDKEKKAYMLLATNLASKMAIDMRLIDPSYPPSEEGKLAIAADTITEHYKDSEKHKGIQLVFSDLGTPKTQNTAENLFNLIESRGVPKETMETIFGAGAYSEKPKYPPVKDIKERVKVVLEWSGEEFDEAVIEANEDNFNVYQEIKNKLIKRGIPSEEIAFIHDYKSDVQKKKLFEAARAGQIRVILGSTAKLGTGVNVQEKIVAMHHIDVPWRPSDMEQRNGRGIRQGNVITRDFYDNELPVYMYATEATLDAYKYQLLGTKQQFIDQAKTGDATSREISEGEGDEESGISFSAMTAMLSGNPVILEKAKIDKKVKELETSRKAFDQEKFTLRDKIARSEKNAERYTETAAKLKKDNELFEQNVTKDEKTGEIEYEATIDGVQFVENPKREKGDKTVRQRVGEKLTELKDAYYESAKTEYKKGRINSITDFDSKVVGSIHGFNIVLSIQRERDSSYAAIGVESPVTGVRYQTTRGADPLHTAIHLQKELREIPQEIDKNIRYSEVARKDAADKKKYLETLPEEFPKKAQLEEAKEQQARVTERLNEMTKATKVPSIDELEALGERIFGKVTESDLDGGNIFALTEDNVVLRVTDKELLNEAIRQNSRFYEYNEEQRPEGPEGGEGGESMQVREGVSDEVAEMRDIVRDFVAEGKTDLEALKNTITQELGDNSPEMRDLIEDAYFDYSKDKKAAPPSVSKEVVSRISKTVDQLFGGNVNVVANEAELMSLLGDGEGAELMKSGGGKILGFTSGKEIYLNGEELNPNTPVHEAGHLWMAWAEHNSADLLNRGLDLVGSSRYLQKVKESPAYQAEANKLPEGRRERYYRKEALASAIGDKGAQFVLEAKAKGFREWMNRLWDTVKRALGLASVTAKELENMTLDEFARRAARDVLAGEEMPSDVSGIKKALVPRDVIEETQFEKMSDDALMRQGREILASGKVKPESLIKTIITEGKGVLTPQEVVALITYKRQLDNELNDAYTLYNEKMQSGKPIGTTGIDIATLEDRKHDYEMMAVITANQQSMAFRLRKKLLDSSFNIVEEVNRYKKNSGGVIPADVLEKFEAAEKKVRELQSQLDQEREAFEKAEAQRAMDDIREAAAREAELEKKISEGVKSVVEGLYQSLDSKKKSYADRALDALSKFKKNLRGRAFDASLGIPVAILDAGITTIEYAIKAGKTVAEAIEIGVDKIKQLLKGKPFDKENDFRQAMTEGFADEGITDEKPKAVRHRDGTITIPNRILRDLIKSGIDTIEDLTEAVKQLIIDDIPDVTDRQVRDFITGYGRQVNPTQDEITLKLAELKRVGKLLSELEDLQMKKLKATDPRAIRKITDRELELKAKIKALSDIVIGETPMSEEEIRRKKEQRVNYLRQQIANLQEQLRLGNFSKKKRDKVTGAKILELEAELQTIKDEVFREQEKVRLQNRTWPEKFQDTATEIVSGLPRALVASLDFSATLVQGVMRWFLSPVMSAKALVESFKQFISPKREEQYIGKLHAQPFYPLLKASGLPIGETNVKLSVKEGVFFLNLANHIYDAIVTGLTLGYRPATEFAKKINPFKASQRAYEGYLNHLRVQVFLNDARRMERRGYRFETDPEVFKQLASNVGTTTGRANLGRHLESAKFLDILFFSIRKLASEVKLFTPLAFLHYAKMPQAVRHRALLDFANFAWRFVALNAAVWAMRKDWDDDEEDHFWDPTSSDFLTHNLNGTRIGIGSGIKSMLVFQSRLLMGQYTDIHGNTEKLGERPGKIINSRLDLIYRFFLGKASPGISIGAQVLDQREGREMTDKEVIEGLVMPMWMQDVKDIYKSHPNTIASFLSAMAMLGTAVRVYDEAPPKKETKTPRNILDRRRQLREQNR
jgi:N12 class adenine-specific DNA methylase